MKKICVVGYGAIGPVHAKAVKNISSAELYAVCDTNPERLITAEKENPGIKSFSDFDEALSDVNVDTVHICTPHHLHFEMIKKALAAGKTVVAEKPVTMTKPEFSNLLKLKGSEKVCVVFQNRYNPCIKLLREITESRKYGEIKEISAEVIWKRDAAYYNSAFWRGTKALEGGGVLINQAIHTLDHMVSLGGEVSVVSASMSNLSLRGVIEVEDTVSACIKFKSGAKGVFFATNTAEINHSPVVEVTYENACVSYRNEKLYLDDEVICSDNLTDFSGKKCWGSGHEILLDDFYTRGNHLSVFDVKNTMDAMFEIYESAAEGGKEIKIT